VSEIVPHGFHAAVGETASDGLEFRLPLVIRGSGSIRFLPLGETTRAAFRSAWPHPSFIGDVLPVERTVDDSGFSAEWTIRCSTAPSPGVHGRLRGGNRRDRGWRPAVRAGRPLRPRHPRRQVRSAVSSR